MSTKIKLCGLFRPEDIQAANASAPDYAGFVFAPSRRQITAQQAKEFRQALNPDIQAVGVFVNERPEQILELLSEGIIDCAQLHGTESREEAEQLRLMSGKPVIKAIKVERDMDLSQYNDWNVDYLLLDSGSGSGEVFDWSRIQGVTRPFFLAGGIHPDNVAEAVRIVHPYGIDVSSGIETNQVKDGAKMKDIVERVRNE